MSFWGLNQSGKDSKAFPREIATWNFQQYKDNLNRANASWDQGQQRGGQMYGYWQNRMGQGVGTPQDVRSAGEQAMPGIGQAVQNRWNRWNDMQSKYKDWLSSYGSPEAMGGVYNALNEQAANIGRHYDAQQNEIGDTANRMMARNDAASRGITGLIGDTFTAADTNWNNTYSDLISKVYGVYGKLQADADKAYGSMLSDAERLRPGSEGFMARTARSYAPMMANTMARLRRSGIDPNSVQAGGVLSQAEVERARAIDDAAAAGDREYVASRRGILGDQLGTNLGIGQSMSDRTTNLGAAQAAGVKALTLGRGEALSAEQLRAMGASNAIDAARSSASLANSQQAYGDSQGWLDRQANAGLMGRNLALQDLGLGFDLQQGMNQEELIGPGLALDQWNAGLNYQNIQTGAQDRAAGYGTQMAQNDIGNYINAATLARMYGNDALQQHLANLQIQGQNAGWGRRMLAGVAGGLANAFLPGSGQFVSGAIAGPYGNVQPYFQGGFTPSGEPTWRAPYTYPGQPVTTLPPPPSWTLPSYPPAP